MPARPIPAAYRAPVWDPPLCEYVTLWHGTTALGKNAIEASGIDLNRCAVDTDFGRGFYTTTVERQARLWAWECYYNWLNDNRGFTTTGNQPIVMRFRVRRHSRDPIMGPRDRGLDSLAWLGFVRGEFANDAYWALVQHCRESTPTAVRDHRRIPNGWYDVVSGPVAAFWRQRAAMADGDQFSFHTPAAVAILQDLVDHGKGRGPGGQGDPDFYRWDVVT